MHIKGARQRCPSSAGTGRKKNYPRSTAFACQSRGERRDNSVVLFERSTYFGRCLSYPGNTQRSMEQREYQQGSRIPGGREHPSAVSAALCWYSRDERKRKKNRKNHPPCLCTRNNMTRLRSHFEQLPR